MGNKNKVVKERHDQTAKDALSPEDELLIHCSRLDQSQARRDAMKGILSGGIDWDLLLEKASWQRLSCLASHHLRAPDLSIFVPQPMLKKLQQIYYMNLARNMFLQDELTRFASILNKEGIPVIVLKGAALLGSVYKDIGLRPMGDLDILLKPEHLDRAEAIAFSQGYIYPLMRDVQGNNKKNTHQLPFLTHSKKGIILELHQYIVDADSPYHFDMSGFWDRARPMPNIGTTFLALSPEDQILHLSIHFLYDRRFGSRSALGQLCDISRLIAYHGNSLNWYQVQKMSDDYHIGPGIHCVLYICEQLLGAQVPASVLEWLQPSKFNTSIVALFIRQRILETKERLPFDVMEKKSQYSYFRALIAIFNKFFRFRENITEEEISRKHPVPFYFKLLKDLVPKLVRVLLKPGELKQDLLLDRWLHDIHRSSDGDRPHDEVPVSQG